MARRVKRDRLRDDFMKSTSTWQTEVSELKVALAAKDARIAELEGLLAYGTDTSEYRRIRARAEQAEVQLAVAREVLERSRDQIERNAYGRTWTLRVVDAALQQIAPTTPLDMQTNNPSPYVDSQTPVGSNDK